MRAKRKGGPDAAELEDDSLSKGSVISDDEDATDGSEGSHINPQSPVSPDLRKMAPAVMLSLSTVTQDRQARHSFPGQSRITPIHGQMA
jgi:hypothetical protein